jgi:hypothetical protein
MEHAAKLAQGARHPLKINTVTKHQAYIFFEKCFHFIRKSVFEYENVS